jgi:hypothetical protein
MPTLRSVLVFALFYLIVAVGSPARAVQPDIYPPPEQASADIAAHYQIPLTKGVPAVAVLNDRGRLLYSQKTGEFEAMRHMQSGSVTDFLLRWKRPG